VRWRGSADLPGIDMARQLIARVEIESGALWAFSFDR
jgi:hypothetical protein